MTAEDVIGKIEQFETVFDTFHQQMQTNLKGFLDNINFIWKTINELKTANQKLMETIKEQDSELMTLKTESEGLDTKINTLKTTKEDLTTKTNELSLELERLSSDLKKPEFELENITKKIEDLNDRIQKREEEKTTLDQKKVEQEHLEEELKKKFAQKMEEVETKIDALKKENFFTSFVIENSPQDLFEVDIIAKIMEQGKCNLNELKKQLEVSPIMAVRTIKQLAVKEVINLNEDTNEITMP